MTRIDLSTARTRAENDERTFIVTFRTAIAGVGPVRVWFPQVVQLAFVDVGDDLDPDDLCYCYDDWRDAYAKTLEMSADARRMRMPASKLELCMFSTHQTIQLDCTDRRYPAMFAYIVDDVFWYHGSIRRVRQAYDRGYDYDQMMQYLRAH